MLNILKNAAVYTGLYFICVIAWTILLIGAQVFWKPVAIFFVCALAWFGFKHVTEGACDDVTDHARKAFDEKYAGNSVEENMAALKHALATNSKL